MNIIFCWFGLQLGLSFLAMMSLLVPPMVLSVLQFRRQWTFCFVYSCFVNLLCLSNWRFCPKIWSHIGNYISTSTCFTVVSSLSSVLMLSSDVSYWFIVSSWDNCMWDRLPGYYISIFISFKTVGDKSVHIFGTSIFQL